MPDLRRIVRNAIATREAKFGEVQRHYIQIYLANFFVILYKIYPPLAYVKIKAKKR